MSGPPVLVVVGARPQFIKAAALWLHLADHPEAAAFTPLLVHSGQHYDELLSDVFFEELPLPAPAHELGVGEFPQTEQFAEILIRCSALLAEVDPAAVLVVGDTTTTLAAALAAGYADVPVVHLEAGERAYRRHRYPEETNRVLADHLAAMCLTATERATLVLRGEGMSPARVRFVGDVMLDLFLWGRSRALPLSTVAPPGLRSGDFDLATLHRAENTDDDLTLVRLLGALDHAPRPVVLPAHPRLAKRCNALGWQASGSLQLIPPVGYLAMLSLLDGASQVVTDSGGLMREAFFAATPCIVPAGDSPWGEIVRTGWAWVTGDDTDRLLELLESFPRPDSPPPPLFGDGHAAAAVVAAVNEVVAVGQSPRAAWEPEGTAAG